MAAALTALTELTLEVTDAFLVQHNQGTKAEVQGDLTGFVDPLLDIEFTDKDGAVVKTVFGVSATKSPSAHCSISAVQASRRRQH